MFRGVLLMIAVCLLVPLLDVFSKLVTDQIPVAKIKSVCFLPRSLFLCPVFFSWVFFVRAYGVFAYAFLRPVFLIFSTVFFVTAISVMPLADTLAIVFI